MCMLCPLRLLPALQARLLCIALAQAFFSTSPEAQEEVAELVGAEKSYY